MHRIAFISFALVSICIGCSSSSTETEAGAPPPATGTTATAYADVQAIFDKNCVACHGATNPKGGIELTSHDALMKSNVVTAGDPANSVLIQALRGTNGKKQMPVGAAPLPEDDIKKVESWIKDGAKS